MTQDHRRRCGFTLVEILIVVMILGILAAVAIPKFANASQSARESSLKDNLRLLRTQLGVYKSQHSLYPGYPGGDGTQTPTAAAAANQLLQYTDFSGNTSATGSASYKWGPYLNILPLNPVNGNASLKILSEADAFTPDGTTGWLYQPSSGQVKANVAGNDSTGRAYIDY
jgi:general secretion pathway protein G